MILRRMSTVTLVGVIIATLLFANTASANHGFGSTLTVRDNNTQDYEMVSLTSAGRIACEHGAEQLERSEISVESGSDDIHCHDFVAGTLNWAGETRCIDVNWWNQRCDHFQIDFNLTGFDTTPDTPIETSFWKTVGCHEFGHTGGLAHVGLTIWSCMRYAIPTNAYSPTTFNQNDLNDIDADL